MKKTFFLSLLCLAFFACKEPHPFYGKWADNDGDTITFINDGSFIAKIDDGIVVDSYDGSFTVLANALSLTFSDDRTMVSEWDIRGNILYMTWKVGSVDKQLTLYKTSH